MRAQQPQESFDSPWFRQNPIDASLSVACRAALRALPGLGVAVAEGQTQRTALLSVFRANAVAWAAAKYRKQRRYLRAAARQAQEILDSSYERTDRSPFSYAIAAAFTAASQLKAAADAAEYVASTERFAARDITVIGAVEARAERSRIAIELASKSPWPARMPAHRRAEWLHLKNALLSLGEDWEVWIDWYEDRAAGRPSRLGEAFDIALATLPNELWERGPEVVNARIKELINEYTPVSLPTEESLPPQTPRAAIFQPQPTGVIGLAPPTPADRLADTMEVRDLYGETREKLDNLTALGRNMLGDRLDRASGKLRSRMPDAMSEAIERLVWSGGNTLRSILSGHDAVAGDRDPHPDKLDQGVAERLRDVIDTFNQLAVADPALRQRDARRPGPQEHQRTLSELETVADVVTEAASDRNITAREAGEQLLENAAISNEGGTSLTERLAVELTRDTDRNFVAGAVISVYRMLRNLPALARGEGGFISKEYFSGFCKYAGGATAVALAGTIAGAYYVRWEIVEFIVSNADQLRLYGAYAFAQSPGFKQMIDWLEAHVRIGR